jgi:hypothetical protein
MALISALLLAAPAEVVASDESDPAALRRWYEHGRCLVKRQGPLAEKMLASRPASLDATVAFLRADTDAQCFNEGSAPAPKLHYNATRGAVVEALLLRDFLAVGQKRGSHVAAVASMSGPPQPGGSTGAAHAEAMLAFAECVVKAEPTASFAIFSTEVSSPAEEGAARSLAPAMGQCLPPGFQFTLKTPVLRSYLAEAAYRVSVQRPHEASK